VAAPLSSKSTAFEDLVAPSYTEPGNNGFGVVVLLTLALFIGAGLYFKTIKPRERAIAESAAKLVQTQFVMREKTEKPKPPSRSLKSRTRNPRNP